ncbi:hypothetical protein [Actinomadura parmotrematis]|uniref:Lipoprotein n=1 Tax=Actinomadura parmotrematis TaxID=2864039 RepID=A0ABS7FQ36_9ACTN|nr:hypothetical protein [Actinomadura parmotrematis]MBW8482426.1 hypothetical protein [Actinomadura parmotrematis]
MRRPLTAALLPCLLLTAGCSLGNDPSPKSAATPGASAPGASTTGPASAGTPAAGGRFPTAQAAAEALLAAWHKGDKNAALKAGGPRTVDKVFAGAVDTTTRIQSCRQGSAVGVSYAYDCYYAAQGGGSTHFYVDPYPATGWRVVNFAQNNG